MNPHASLGFALLLCASATVSGQSAIERQHESHVHGQALLQLGLESNALYARLESPAGNIYGFEHAPANNRQREIVASADALLARGETLLVVSDATCELDSVDLQLPFADTGPVDAHEAAHSHDHANDHGDEHEHAGSDDHADHATHSEITAEYRFTCDRSLPGVQIGLFSHFPGFEAIDVQWIGPDSQGQFTATPANPEVRFAP